MITLAKPPANPHLADDIAALVSLGALDDRQGSING
jgi:hypothetical protein